MNTSASTNRYKNHHFPAEIISHGVWLYFRFCLSYRDVEELLFVRGVTVSHEVIRKWCHKLGQTYANALRHRRSQPGDKWRLDEVFLTIHGERHYLWRAVGRRVESERFTQRPMGVWLLFPVPDTPRRECDALERTGIGPSSPGSGDHRGYTVQGPVGSTPS